MEPGTKVRMTQSLKDGMIANGSHEHIEEFGGCVGIVIGLVDYGSQKGPEVDVRWQPSDLRYGYHPDDLEVVKDITIKTTMPFIMEAGDYHEFRPAQEVLQQAFVNRVLYEEIDVDSGYEAFSYKAIFYLEGQEEEFLSMKEELIKAYEVEDE